VRDLTTSRDSKFKEQETLKVDLKTLKAHVSDLQRRIKEEFTCTLGEEEVVKLLRLIGVKSQLELKALLRDRLLDYRIPKKTVGSSTEQSPVSRGTRSQDSEMEESEVRSSQFQQTCPTFFRSESCSQRTFFSPSKYQSQVPRLLGFPRLAEEPPLLNKVSIRL